MLNKLFRKNIKLGLEDLNQLERFTTLVLIDYLNNHRDCTLYTGLERRMYALDMNREFSDQEWNEFRLYVEKYYNEKIFQFAEEILEVWDLKKQKKLALLVAQWPTMSIAWPANRFQ